MLGICLLLDHSGFLHIVAAASFLIKSFIHCDNQNHNKYTKAIVVSNMEQFRAHSQCHTVTYHVMNFDSSSSQPVGCHAMQTLV